ncbi:hypothetical protein [Opitutus sp. GAS368]|jgi:hypothetical protein|uniref:hypothetical protein n=1 Tax=Opitutus sp. GAS368 TaxID=1882749 RepID=UPI00087AEC7A|nr:hypothetical protein [Opitutus sp. GAS368]SDS09914.1 hypothetical protein SAMN05444173_1885 [Opitutus sp. GAS368]
MESDDPPPKVYGFKEREFTRDNVRMPGAAPLPTAKELAVMAGPVTASPKGATGPKAGDPNDVYATLQQNRAVEKKLTGDEIEIRKIKSRRWRDYLLILLPSEILLGTITVLGRGNPVVFVSGLAGMIMIGVTITWIMWQVMDRY